MTRSHGGSLLGHATWCEEPGGEIEYSRFGRARFAYEEVMTSRGGEPGRRLQRRLGAPGGASDAPRHGLSGMVWVIGAVALW